MVPLVSELGAKTYQMLTGEQIEFTETSSYLAFLNKIPSSHQKAVADQIVQFVDPTSQTVRNYLLRLLNTAFLVQAVTLSEAAMTGLISRTQKRLKLRIFVDTNFLFSLIGLHENPADDVVNALHDLINKMKSRVDVKLYMLPCTMAEAKKAIQIYQDRLSGFHFHRGIRMALRSGTSRLSGITLRYIQDALNASRPVSSQQYFKPYLENFRFFPISGGRLVMREAIGVEVEASEVEVDGVRKAFLVAEAAAACLDRLDPAVDAFGGSVGRT